MKQENRANHRGLDTAPADLGEVLKNPDLLSALLGENPTLLTTFARLLLANPHFMQAVGDIQFEEDFNRAWSDVDLALNNDGGFSTELQLGKQSMVAVNPADRVTGF
jgi:hypothetical protein